MTVRAHFDGQQIQLDVPVELHPDTVMWVTVLSPEEKIELEQERNEWEASSLANLAEFYKDEPDLYSDDMIIERNPHYRETW